MSSFNVEVPVDGLSALVPPNSNEAADYTWEVSKHLLSMLGMEPLDADAPIEKLVEVVSATAVDSWAARHIIYASSLQAVKMLVDDGLVQLVSSEDSDEAAALVRQRVSAIAEEVARAIHVYAVLRFAASRMGWDVAQVSVDDSVVDFTIQLLEE